MKKLLFILLLLPFLGISQTVGHFRYDTTKFYKVGGSNEVIIENATKDITNGFLQNYAQGRTRFARALDSVWVDGDSLRFRYGTLELAVKAGAPASRFGVSGEDATAGENRTFDIGSLYDFIIKHENVPLETWSELYIDKTGRTGMRTYWGGSDSAYIDVGQGEINLRAYRYKMHDPGDPTSSNLKMVVWDSVDNYLRVTSIPSGSGDTANLLFDSLGTAGISPVTVRDDALMARRISVTGGLAIDTSEEGGIVIDASGVSGGAIPVSYVIAASDENTDLTTGTAKVTFRMPHAMTVTGVRASVNTVSSSGLPTVDIKEAGASILSTLITIDASEKSSTTAATAAVISDSALADDAEITIDITVAGTGAKGLKVIISGTRAL